LVAFERKGVKKIRSIERFYRWLIRQVSQHNQENVIQQKDAEALHEVLVELCEACTDGDHVAAPHERGSHFHFCKENKEKKVRQ
jgi:hypothetical protein